jgi:hypothetical protein
MLKCEIIKTTHKETSNKTFEINKIINRTLRQLVCVILK